MIAASARTLESVSSDVPIISHLRESIILSVALVVSIFIVIFPFGEWFFLSVNDFCMDMFSFTSFTFCVLVHPVNKVNKTIPQQKSFTLFNIVHFRIIEICS